MKQYAFFFDSNACSGCKTCQIACRDKHDLPARVQWRRVYEVAGGSWKQDAKGNWKPEIVAYNLSMSCNHCEDAICVASCPTKALQKRQDGIVFIDPEKCMGCRYCEWACPYGAPQYNKTKGIMTKCDFCLDYLEQGKDPSCVASCPMRVLEFGEAEELFEKYGREHVYPMPDFRKTKPAFAVKKQARYNDHESKSFEIINREEINHA